jgi:hypothetical protein
MADAYGAYANYETAYNVPEIPISLNEMTVLQSEKKLPNTDTITRAIRGRENQKGGAPDATSKFLFHQDLIRIGGQKDTVVSIDSDGFITMDKQPSKLYKLRFELVSEPSQKLNAIHYKAPVYMVYNDKSTGEKKYINNDGSKLNNSQNSQVKYMFIDPKTPTIDAAVDMTREMFIKTVDDNKFLQLKDENNNKYIMMGNVNGTAFRLYPNAKECGPLWMYGSHLDKDSLINNYKEE